jgi:hypothetical protein
MLQLPGKRGNVYKKSHISPFQCKFPMPFLFATALFGCADAVPLAYATFRTIIHLNYVRGVCGNADTSERATHPGVSKYNSNDWIAKQDVTRRVRDPSGRKEDEGGVNPAMKM